VHNLEGDIVKVDQGNRISPERWKFARGEYESGRITSKRKIAEMLGCADNAVRSRILKEGWKKPGEVVAEASEVFGEAADAFAGNGEKSPRSGQSAGRSKNSGGAQQRPLPVTPIHLIEDGREPAGASGGGGSNTPPPGAAGACSSPDDGPQHPMSVPFPEVPTRMTMAAQRQFIERHAAERGRALTQWHSLELAQLNSAVQAGLSLAAAGNPDGLIQVKTAQLAVKMLAEKQVLERAQLEAQKSDALAMVNYNAEVERAAPAQAIAADVVDVEVKVPPVSADVIQMVRHTIRRKGGAVTVSESPLTETGDDAANG
jgi:hypothetical protein